MNSTIEKLQEKCATLETRVEEQENRGRRNNLRLVGLPERADGQDVCIFGRMATKSSQHRRLPHPTCHNESASDRTSYRWPRSKTKGGNYEVPQLQRKRKSYTSSPKTERRAVWKPQRQILSRLFSGNSLAAAALWCGEKAATTHAASLSNVLPGRPGSHTQRAATFIHVGPQRREVYPKPAGRHRVRTSAGW